MKITLRKLKALIEAQLTVSDEDIEKAKAELGKEGGAAGPEDIAKVVDPEGEYDPEDIVTALIDADDNIKQSDKGDLVDMGTMVSESILSRSRLRKIIMQEVRKALRGY